MSLSLSSEVLRATECEELAEERKPERMRYKDRPHDFDPENLRDEVLKDIARAAETVGEKKVVRAVAAILAAREGKPDLRVPNFGAFKGMLDAFLRKSVIRGWLFVQAPDGHLYPELITRVRTETSGRHEEHPHVTIDTICYGLQEGSYGSNGAMSMDKRTHQFSPVDVVNKRVVQALEAKGLWVETQALIDDYEEAMKRHNEVVAHGFGQQFRFEGTQYVAARYHRTQALSNRKVVHDLGEDALRPYNREGESKLLPDGLGAVPEHPLVRFFDLKAHEFFWANSAGMTSYVYDKSLRDKLILPQTHRDLLDVLTGDLDAFVQDLIEGKSAGNIIVCKGQPGVGKTLTAEVYAELIGAPLYSIHTGTLGTTADRINKNLQEVFELYRRWPNPPVLLLDEADVFVAKRGDDLEQNAIVAEFLRVLEYFEGLLFLTTNRANDIDDAVLSRAAAIIDYDAPDAELSKQVWRVMAKNFETELSEDLIDQLVNMFPRLPPRDIKNLLKLVLKFVFRFDQPMDLELFRRTAMFRGIKMRGT